MSDFNNFKEIKKTRKEHQCNGCREKIPAGSSAAYYSGVFEGNFFSAYLCRECDEYLTKHLEDFEDGWSDGDIGSLRWQEEETTDEEGGIHGGGVGHNPQGVFCGECGFVTCKGCINEHVIA